MGWISFRYGELTAGSKSTVLRMKLQSCVGVVAFSFLFETTSRAVFVNRKQKGLYIFNGFFPKRAWLGYNFR